MVCLKKVYQNELLHLALILSLLRVDPNSYLGFDSPVVFESGNRILGPSWGYTQTQFHNIHNQFDGVRNYLHPKSVDSALINYERDIIEELNALGRYNRIGSYLGVSRDVTAYLLNVESSSASPPTGNTASDHRRTVSPNSPSDEIDSLSAPTAQPDLCQPRARTTDETIEGANTLTPHEGAELTQEDMDLIEVLWKQDVDLGIPLGIFNGQQSDEESKKEDDDDVLVKLEVGKAVSSNDTDIGQTKDVESLRDEKLDPWAGLNYTIDSETGEHILEDVQENLTNYDSGVPEDPESPLSDTVFVDFTLEEALRIVGLEDETPVEVTHLKEESEDAQKEDVESDDYLGDMIQTAHAPPHHPRAFQGRMPFGRTMSMEQRWQDLANLLSLPAQDAASQGVVTHSSFMSPHHPHHHPVTHSPHHHHHHPGLAPPPGHGPYSSDTARSVLIHNATLAPPVGDISNSSGYPNVTMGGSTNLGSAVATSMNLTNSSEPMGDSGGQGVYKLDGSHDLMYYQTNATEMNQTTEGFLSAILNDDDLQLMDMAMNEGMYSMRMLDNTTGISASAPGPPLSGGVPPILTVSEERIDASSDSAVSSMGSERVASVSDGEWMETGSDSGHNGEPYSSYAVDCHNSSHKFRPYDYSYGGRHHASASDPSHRLPHGPVAQKKHQMYGKRYFQDSGTVPSSSRCYPSAPAGTVIGNHVPSPLLNLMPPVKYEYDEASGSTVPGASTQYSSPIDNATAKHGEMKYSCTMDFVRHQTDMRPHIESINHNHSYHLPTENTGAQPRPITRDKLKGRREGDEHLSRDEKRARALNVPMTVDDIINLPMDEFNERLSKYDLTEAQLSLIRDIRRRGKNKVAAQNCRKRKLDQIMSLADEVKQLRDKKMRILRDREMMLQERQRLKERFSQLYRHVFQALRDPEGNPYSPYEYSLQQSADGNVLLVPRNNSTEMVDPDPSTMQQHKSQGRDHQKE